jgi:dCTP deaminase
MQLSAQSIRKLCANEPGMITPFTDEKTVVNGKSYGLSAASYDVRIAHDLVLGPSPGDLLASMMLRNQQYTAEAVLELWRSSLRNLSPSRALAHTIEDFNMPHNVVGYVCDKSTYARVFVSAFNTLFDPGFRGNATLELVNLGSETVYIKAGDPICQFTFHWLDEATERPYNGKYQNQPARPVAAILEG